MNRIQELIKELCPNGVEWKKLGEICSVYDGTHQTPKYVEDGIPFISVENIKDIYNSKKYISKEAFDAYKIKPQIGDVFLTRIGTIGACAVFNKQEDIAYYVSLALLRPSNTLNSYYLKYILESSIGVAELRKRTLINAVPIKVNKEEIGKIEIPVPPLPVQTEIVRILDKFVEQQEQLEKLIELRTKQYEYYREEMLTAKEGEETIPLADIAEIGTGSSNTNEELENGKYPFFVRSQEVRSKNEYEFDEEAIITSGDGVGVGKIFHYINGKYALHQRAYRIHIIDKKILPKFFFYYMKNTFLEYINKTEFKSSVQSIRRPMLNNYPVPSYSIEKQKEIIDIFDSFESSISALTSALELSKKRYEHYRDEMLRF